ncbi:hypothetical protein K1X76_00080 [bacterium]|nr:hypothetical protein [bacterium]
MKLFGALSALSFLAALIMYQVGSTNGHLTELKDFFWVPIPLGILSAVLAFKKKN